MKKIFTLLFLVCFLLSSSVLAWTPAEMSRTAGARRAVSAASYTDPDWATYTEDNAASQTVTARIGSDGDIYGEGVAADRYTSANTSTTASQGSRSFEPTTSTKNCVRSAALTDTAFEDGGFTLEFAFWGDGVSSFSNTRRAFSNTTGGGETQLMASFYNNDTDLELYLGGSKVTGWNVGGNEAQLTDFNDGNWHYIRMVVDSGATNTVEFWECSGTAATCDDESNFSLADYTTSSFTNPTLDTGFQIRFGGNGATDKNINVVTGKMDDISIWYTAVQPEN